MSNKRAVQVTEPKLRFKTDGGTTIELWVLDIGQWANLAEHRSFHFRAEKSASLIYVTKGPGGYHATEEHIDNASTWAWIQEHMAKGIALAGQRQEDTKNPPPLAQQTRADTAHSKAYTMGWYAFDMPDQDRRNNPFMLGSAEHTEWNRGYDEHQQA